VDTVLETLHAGLAQRRLTATVHIPDGLQVMADPDRLRRYAQQEEIAAGSAAELVRDPRVAAFYWGLVQAKQQALPSFEQVKRIALLEQEFSQAAGELTPTLKAKRTVIAQRYAAVLDALYQPAP